jgi:hypothetical protein
MYKGKCAECNAVWNSNAFKSRRAGFALPGADERRLGFSFESAQNNKICRSCYLKNYKVLKHSREEQNRKGASEAKKAKVDENDAAEYVPVPIVVGEVEVVGNADVSEKEGIAISVMLCLSKL